MRVIATFSKLDEVRFVSHLDMQRLFQRAFRRAGLPLAYSQGFNPHPLLSFATALSVGYTSSGEYFDVILTEHVDTDEFTERVNSVLPNGVRIIEAKDACEFKGSLTPLMQSADYSAKLLFDAETDETALRSAVDSLLGGEIIVDKKTKGGIKSVDIRPMLVSLRVLSVEGLTAELEITGKLTAEGGLPLELLFGALYERLGARGRSLVHRKRIEMDWTKLK